MSVTMHLPSVLRKMADDQARVTVEAESVHDAVTALCDDYPELGKHLLDADGNVRPFVRLFLDQEDTANLEGAKTPVKDGQTIRIIPAIAGG